MDNDGYIEPGEVTTYVYSWSDMDDDGYLQQSEYEDRTMTWYEYYDMEPREYVYWDKNSDGRLDSSEVDTLVAENQFYADWDTNNDGQISTSEFAMGTFMAYDDNSNGSISQSEWMDVVM